MSITFWSGLNILPKWQNWFLVWVDQNWLPVLCDRTVLMPCDFFQWGFVKSHVYEKKPRTVEELKNQIYEFTGTPLKRTVKQLQPISSIRLEQAGRDRLNYTIFHTYITGVYTEKD